LERFEREARSASAVEHPNICPIYEFGEHENQPFIVMQLLEGQTLRERIGIGGSASLPFRTDELLDLAIQVAEGLDSAHQKGIIHRDIKPANIFITNRGEVKILDFGLAKLAEVQIRASFASEMELEGPNSRLQDTTEARAADLGLTRTGVALGTAAYMSPEQVRGEKLDRRTDLFSFGLVLYEMATGHPAFSGQTTAILHAAILNSTPTPAQKLNPELPAKLEDIISKAVEKNRDARYQTASALRADLEILRHKLEPKHRASFQQVAGATFVFLVAAAILWFANHHQSPSQGLPEIKLRQLTRNASDDPIRSGSISPDGKYLAYADRQGIHIEAVATGESHLLPQPPGVKFMASEWLVADWFPDGTRLLVNLSPPIELEAPNRQSSIWAASVLGGAPRMLRDNANACSVSPDGRLINFNTNYGRFGPREIWVMNSNGEGARKLYQASDDSIDIVCGPWSPDGYHFISVIDRGLGQPQDFQIRDLQRGLPRMLFASKQDVSTFVWLRDGRFIYSLEEEDAPGTCNLWERELTARGELMTKPRRLTSWAGFCMNDLSSTADGKQLAVTETKDRGSVFVAAMENTAIRLLPKQLTFSDGWDVPQTWTPDSKAVIFASNRSGNFGIYKQALDSETADLLVTGPDNYVPSCVSPDGRSLLYDVHAKHDTADIPDRIMRIPISGGPVEPVLTGHISGIWCASAPATSCVISERTTDRSELVFTAFDPLKGRERGLARFETEPSATYAQDLMRDGSHIASVKRLSEGTITILSLADRSTREVSVKGWTGLETVSWAADGRGLFATTHVKQSSILLRIDLAGNARVLWTQGGGTGLKAIPSPDGRHLALFGRVANDNMWMMQHF
jgi:serine/threonine protein kinase